MAEISVLLAESLRALYTQCRRETGYQFRSLLAMLEQYGSVETARLVLRSEASADFQHLCELRRPDLTIEARILTFPGNDEIFSHDELAVAKERLAAAESLVRSRRIAER